MTRLAFSAVFGFVLGVMVSITSYDHADKAKAKETAQLVRECSGYRVQDEDGTIRCREMMPDPKLVWPIPGDPLKLKKREIRKAVGG